ncbi:hypothetical protein PVAP13_9KG344032 [Panicum virgatum]|uniref:Uncharacterized protein n=1 Tax=Panicum virgatum TaxID=38727 RepID=A0A8T0NPA2_PANVG|nr:hypothetical protein PVAP13_9KG344032 [Panicum virgatum]
MTLCFFFITVLVSQAMHRGRVHASRTCAGHGLVAMSVFFLSLQKQADIPFFYLEKKEKKQIFATQKSNCIRFVPASSIYPIEFQPEPKQNCSKPNQAVAVSASNQAHPNQSLISPPTHASGFFIFLFFIFVFKKIYFRF